MNKLTAVIASAILCFSLIADAKTVKIPQQLFGFTFGAPITVHRDQCKSLRGTWNYQWDRCEKPHLVGMEPECDIAPMTASSSRREHEDGTITNVFSFLYIVDPGKMAPCRNKWLEWAHTTLGEPSSRDISVFRWGENESDDRVRISSTYNSLFIWFFTSSKQKSEQLIEKPTVPESPKERATQLYLAKVFAWLNTFVSTQCGKSAPVTTKVAIFIKYGSVSGYNIGDSGNREFDSKVRSVMGNIFGRMLPPTPYPNILDSLKDNALGKALYVNISGRSSPCRIVAQ